MGVRVNDKTRALENEKGNIVSPARPKWAGETLLAGRFDFSFLWRHGWRERTMRPS